jgi:tetratricopeptide (TPR) repeat protein
MNELFEGGIRWSYPGEFEDGLRGLYFVADAYNGLDDMYEAGSTFERLLAIEPDNALWANNAGFFLREAAVGIEREGRRLCEAAAGRIEDPEALARLRSRAGLAAPSDDPAGDREALARIADERLATARAVIERCLAAYETGARLAPEDVRIVNDLALILIYYVHRDLERAEELLQHGVEVGRRQVEAAEAELAAATEEQRAELETRVFDLRSAWGDCHENLGVLRYVYGNDATGALPWLERAVEIGPARPPLTNSLLPTLRGEAERDDYWNLTAWASPCDRR